MKKAKTGFTLIEMLVVIGIIAVLMGALLAGFGHVTRSAQNARATETVHNVAGALEKMLLEKGRWPTDCSRALLKYGGKDGEGMGCVEDVARVFAKYKALSVSTRGSIDGDASAIQLVGTDRCGIVDPWAVAVLKRRASGGKDLQVPTGGRVQDHIIYFAVDDDHDGIVEATVCGEAVRVRAKAIAWCAGADGKLGSGYRKREGDNADNIYSWARAQEEK